MLLNSIVAKNAAFMLFLYSATAAQGAQICVSVLDELRKPLGGALVRVVDSLSREVGQGVVDQKGVLCMDISGSTYFLEIERNGFTSAKYGPFNIAIGQRRRVALMLPTAEGTEGNMGIGPSSSVRGTIKSRSGPVSAARVCLLRLPEQPPEVCMLSDGAGEFTFIVTPGTYRLSIGAVGSVVYAKEVSVTASSEALVIDLNGR
jgi:hypothetical protein